MRCPFCDNQETKVIDSRPTEDGHAIRRRRECERCSRRFTTYEKVEEVILMVVKKDGSREAFDRRKIMNGIIKACEKRPVTVATIENMVDQIERGLNNMMEKEIDSYQIREILNDFLGTLSRKDRDIFVRRYWYIDSIREIAQRHQVTETNVKSNLYRSRKKLLKIMNKEGIL